MAKLSRGRAESAAVWGLLVHAVFAFITYLMARWTGSAANQVLAWQIAAGMPFWLVCLLHLRGERLAEQEEGDWRRLLAERQAGGGKGALFEVEEGEAFLLRHRLRALERIWLPVISALLVVALGALSFLAFRALVRGGGRIAVDNTLLAAGFLAVEAFLCFLVGMYAAGMARESVWRHLRAGASYMMFCAAAMVLVIVALLAARYDFPKVDRIAAYLLAGVLGVLALEILFSFIVNIYRPRVPGGEVRYAYDSRLLELITSPGSILRTAATTLDYQFGFKVSDTWFYRFLERAIAPILLFQFIAFYLLTSLAAVGPEQKAVIERFGRPGGGGRIVGPGLHLKWPWPVEQVYRFPAQRIRSFTVGYVGEDPNVDRLWTVQHFALEYDVLVATEPEIAKLMRTEPGREAPPPVSLLACNLVVHYRLKEDPKALHNYLYKVGDADELLQALSYREMTRYMASVDFFRVMCVDREKVGGELRQRIQQAADKVVDGGLGLEVIYVGLQGVHPPVGEEVGETFQQVVAAQQEKQAAILRAETSGLAKVTLARHEAVSTISSAIGYRYQRGAVAQGEADRFEKQFAAHQVAPRVYETRELLDNIEDVLARIRKYVVVAQGWDTEVIKLDLSEAGQATLLDVSVGEPKPGEKKETTSP